MNKTAANYTALTLIISLLLFSCLPQKKIVSTKKELAAVDNQLVIHSNQLKELDIQRQKKQDQNEIDDTTNSRIQKFINKTNAEIDTLINQNTILIGETVVNKDDWRRLLSTLSSSRGSRTIR